MKADAVYGEGIDAAVPAHYGSPYREQRALVDGRAITDLSHLDIVQVRGQDRLSWLHNLTTQHLKELAPGYASELLLLNPEGRIQVPAYVLDDGETTYLITDVGQGQELVDFLNSMRFTLRVEVALSDLVAIGAYNRELPGLVWHDPWPHLVGDTVAYGPTDDHPGSENRRVIALLDKAEADRLLETEDCAGMLAWEAQRIADLRPRGRELDEKSLPHEWDWLRTAVHLDKGCYRGQESVARIVNLGRPPRRAVLVHLDGSAERLPEPGSAIYREERAVGILTSVARDMDLGPIGLGLIKRNTPVDADLVVDGITAKADVIVTPQGQTERSYERPKLR